MNNKQSNNSLLFNNCKIADNADGGNNARIICVTNRHLCQGDFLERIESIAACRPAAIILREKDMEPAEYKELAELVIAIGKCYQVPVILHSFMVVALELSHPAIHLPLPLLRELRQVQKVDLKSITSEIPGNGLRFTTLGASCHSVEEAVEAEKLGCTYITVGHIFATSCKAGLPPRGLGLLQEVCQSVSIPVWAIGGISPECLPQVLQAGAAGGCIMSGLMECTEPREILK